MEKTKLAPSLRFKGFTETWEQRTIGDISKLVTKGTTPIDKSGDGTINYVKVENIDSFSGEISNLSKISEEEHKGYLRRSQLQDGDILFSIAGTLGRITTVNNAILPANTNQALAIIRLNKGDIRFVQTALKGKVVEEFVRKNPTVGAQPNLSLEQVKSLIIDYPNDLEQSTIGTFFDKLDKLITLHQRKYDKLTHMKAALLEKMFPQKGENTPRVRFKGFADAWEQCKLGEVCDVLTGGEAPNDFIKSISAQGEYKYPIFSNGLGMNALWGFSKTYSVNVPAITFSSIGTLGYPELRNPYFTPIIRLKVIIPKDSSYDISFVKNALSLSDFSNNASGIPNINAKAVKDIELKISKNYDEQKMIGHLFNQVDTFITLHQRKLEKLKNLKNACLEKMFV